MAFAAGAAIGVLGGLIGLCGAEFRLPLLIGLFGFAALGTVILNKAMSLVVVLTALPARMFALPYTAVAAHWTIAAKSARRQPAVTRATSEMSSVGGRQHGRAHELPP